VSLACAAPSPKAVVAKAAKRNLRITFAPPCRFSAFEPGLAMGFRPQIRALENIPCDFLNINSRDIYLFIGFN
jgi:hypothetical protein